MRAKRLPMRHAKSRGLANANSVRIQPVQLLVLADSTQGAENLLEYAQHLAQILESEVQLLHIVDLDKFLESGRPLSVARMANAGLRESVNRAASFREIIRNRGVNVRFAGQLAIRAGQLEPLLRLVETTQPAMLIIGRDCFSRHLIESMVRKTLCPSIIIPDTYTPCKSTSLVLYSDKQRLHEHVLYPVLNFIANTGLKLSILSIVKRKKFGTRKFESFLPCSTCHTAISFYQQEGQEPLSAIAGFVRTNSADMVCTILRNHSKIRRFFYRWNYLDLASKIEVPLLVYQMR